MKIFWQVNQSNSGKYSHSGHFMKQLTGIADLWIKERISLVKREHQAK